MSVAARSADGPADPPAGLGQLYEAVDEECRRLEVTHGARLSCRRGCHECCTDGITVFAVEAENIRRRHVELLKNGQPAPAGGCAFLDAEGGCRIYPERPYVCRTHGLPLRWLDEIEGGGMVELRDICPLNEPGPALEGLTAEDCWSIGPAEEQLARLELRRSRGESRRVPLRELFGGGKEKAEDGSRDGGSGSQDSGFRNQKPE